MQPNDKPLLDGTPVYLMHDLDRYPHFLLPAGSTGTIRHRGGDGVVVVEVDQYVAGLAEWSNEVVYDPSGDYDEHFDDWAPIEGCAYELTPRGFVVPIEDQQATAKRAVDRVNQRHEADLELRRQERLDQAVDADFQAEPF